MLPTLIIPDAKGNEREYRLVVLEAPAWCKWLGEVSEIGGDHTYVVTRIAGDHWTCTCPDFTCRKRQDNEFCKHVLSIQEYLEMTVMQTLEAEAQSAVNGDQATLPEAPTSNLPAVQPDTAPLNLAQPRPGGNLALALEQARQRCRTVPSDSYNAHFKYHYASSEAIFIAAGEALADSGLVLIPLEMSVNGTAEKGAERFELIRKFMLLHSSGQWVPITAAWPIVVAQGRPLDKATAIADTLSLAYLYRDLLLMPRVAGEDEINKRKEQEERQRGQQEDDGEVPNETPAAEPKDEKAKIGSKRVDALARLVNELELDWGKIASQLQQRFQVTSFAHLTPEQANTVEAGLKHLRSTRAAAAMNEAVEKHIPAA